MLKEYLAKAAALSGRGDAFVTVTLVHPEGHVPQDVGAKAIVVVGGLEWGTVGGGRLEARAISVAQGLLGDKKSASTLIKYDLQRDLGMVCGGFATLYFEICRSRDWGIAVFGAGHVAQAVVPLLASFDCRLFCLDPRADWLAQIPDFDNLDKILAADLAAKVWDLPDRLFYVVMTQGHATDLPVVRQILKRGDAAYVGVIGSKVKARTLRATLMEEGFSREEVQALHCPIGLEFGTNSPAEIAVSVAAQLLQVRDTVAATASGERAIGSSSVETDARLS